MNRSILIVICDFLLLSLLTFSTDINHMADENSRPPSQVAVATNAPASPGADLAAMMKLALTEERKGRDQLQQQLAQVRSAAAQQQTQLSEREQENARLKQQYTAAETNLDSLGRQLQNVSAQAQAEQQQIAETRQQLAAAQQKLATTQSGAQQESELAATLRRQLDSLNQSNQLALAEKQRLAGQLQLAEAQRSAAADRAALMQQQVEDTRAENARLAEGLRMLATNSSQLTQEIRANRPLAPNTIFSTFVANRVRVDLVAARTGLFGQDAGKTRSLETVLVTDGTNDFALCHVSDTPLTLWDPGTDWQKITGTLSWQGTSLPVHSLSFAEADPRVVLIPVAPAEALRLGCKIYEFSSEPYKFQDAVLVGVNDGYYGQCDFQLDERHPQYLRLDRSVLRGLFGKFNPSRGDLVFSRRGELLGIMVNNTYCLTLRHFAARATLPGNQDLRSLHTGGTLAKFYDDVFEMPPALQ
jgi:hypothetical protein